jgi:20S proteasome subunit alpha 3
MEAISHGGTVLCVLATNGSCCREESEEKLLDLPETKQGGYGGSGKKVFLLNWYV